MLSEYELRQLRAIEEGLAGQDGRYATSFALRAAALEPGRRHHRSTVVAVVAVLLAVTLLITELAALAAVAVAVSIGAVAVRLVEAARRG